MNYTYVPNQWIVYSNQMNYTFQINELYVANQWIIHTFQVNELYIQINEFDVKWMNSVYFQIFRTTKNMYFMHAEGFSPECNNTTPKQSYNSYSQILMWRVRIIDEYGLTEIPAYIVTIWRWNGWELGRYWYKFLALTLLQWTRQTQLTKGER